MSSAKHLKTKYLKDYHKPNFNIKKVFLTFRLNPKKTIITNNMHIERSISKNIPLVLDGKGLTLQQLKINGVELKPNEYTVINDELTILVTESSFELEITTEINPAQNQRLEGLYISNGTYCTQCEAEGFSNITYFLDRPDVLSVFTTKIISEHQNHSAILSNGNLVDAGVLDTGEKYTIWKDPFKKPCYLFALIAGDLKFIEDEFTTSDGRKIVLRIYVEPYNIDKCFYAMQSLKKAMKWDEDRFGLIYDLDIYMIVAVDDFNMGAMENKGLNIFNSKYVLAKPDTATDKDYEAIESVIAHEYFHNWTGNRVTCRDWFQLTLKEGLTVFRDQEFTADTLSRGVKRIEDVKRLRNYQFLEDDGPLSHPIQLNEYIEINNFYTTTVYEKGAEIIRLYHTLLGESGFKLAMDLYFKRHDGQAVTVEDFRSAMADANSTNLQQMQSWYMQAGTPQLKIKCSYNHSQHTYTINCEQFLKDKQTHSPFLIPIKVGLLTTNGKQLSLYSDDSNINIHNTHEALLIMTKLQQEFTFKKISSEPTPSLLRNFSAPVILTYAYTSEQLCTLACHDSDSFMRWESVQRLAMICIQDNILRYQKHKPFQLDEHYSQVFLTLLQDKNADFAFIANAITLPDANYIEEQYKTIDIEAIHKTLVNMQKAIAERFKVHLVLCYQQHNKNIPFNNDKNSISHRSLKNRCLNYLASLDNKADFISLARQQYALQNNMTDVLAVMNAITHTNLDERCYFIEDFYKKWYQEPLVLDKWFALQASSYHDEVLSQVKELLTNPNFSYTNPNTVRSLLGAFANSGITGFHKKDGEGYEFLANEIIKLDKINPQIAARIIMPFTRWRRYDEARKQKMHEQLLLISQQTDLSKDLFEIIARSIDY